MRFANVDDALLQINEPYDPNTGFADRRIRSSRPSTCRASTTCSRRAALVFDNSLFGYVGPFYGRRYRFEFAQTLGDWHFTQFTADYRRYDQIVGPDRPRHPHAVLRADRPGREAVPDLRRQHRPDPRATPRARTAGTSASTRTTPTPRPGCAALDRLVGTQVGVGSVELRFPILNPSFGLPAAFRRIEGALFYDIGLAWDDEQHAQVEPRAGRRSDPSPHAAPDARRVGSGPTSSASRSRGSTISIPQDARAVEGPLDLQPGADVLDRLGSGSAATAVPDFRLPPCPLPRPAIFPP